MSMSPITSPEQLVALARALRAEGVVVCRWGDIELQMLNPDKPGLGALKEQMADLPAAQREEIIEDVKRSLEADLFGAT